MEETKSESLVDTLIYQISVLQTKERTKSKHTNTSSDKFHPRRHKLYKPFALDSDMFFRLRSFGVPVLTAYFMSEPNNMCKMHKKIQDNCSALSVIKNI